MNLTEMRAILSERGIQLTKSLGQNFLHDGNQLRRIVASGDLVASDRLLEIGPGLGPLTEELLATGAPVLAIEADARLVEVLRGRWKDTPAVELIHGDALEWLCREPRDWTGWKLVANLPYSVASPILVELALAEKPPERLVATLQWEVAQRIAAKPAGEDYGILTLLIQLQFEPAGLFKIPSSCFHPAPDVESGCLVMKRRPGISIPSRIRETYVRVVKAGFSQRRKMMAKLLKSHWPDPVVVAAMKNAGVAATARAETVSREQFLAMAEALCVPDPDDPRVFSDGAARFGSVA